MQGAWTLLLSRFSGQRDILFGAACSGRSPEIPGIDGMVGPCVNDLPVRVQLNPAETLVDFLKLLQEEQFAASQYQYSSVIEIHNWSEMPLRQQLFESLLVFQNYGTGSACQRFGSNIEIQTVTAPETTNYPVTLMIVPGDELHVKILYRTDRYSREAIQHVLHDLQRLIAEMVGKPQRRIADILAALPPYQPKGNEESSANTRACSVVNTSGGGAMLPQTDSEKIVAAIWCALFQVSQVNLDSNFFDLGGHSLLLVEMHKRLERALQRRLPLVELFQHTTVRSLAQYLSNESDTKADVQVLRTRAQQAQQAFAGRMRKARSN